MKIKVEPTQSKLDNSEKSKGETTILMDQTGTNENNQDQSSLIKIELLEKRMELLEFQEQKIIELVELLVKTMKIIFEICMLLSFLFFMILLFNLILIPYSGLITK